MKFQSGTKPTNRAQDRTRTKERRGTALGPISVGRPLMNKQKTKKPNFEKMSLFQLMNWFEENNFDSDTLEPILTDEPDEINPLQDMPDWYKGTLENWEKELDELVDYVKIQYITACNKIQQHKEKA